MADETVDKMVPLCFKKVLLKFLLGKVSTEKIFRSKKKCFFFKQFTVLRWKHNFRQFYLYIKTYVPVLKLTNWVFLPTSKKGT